MTEPKKIEGVDPTLRALINVGITLNDASLNDQEDPDHARFDTGTFAYCIHHVFVAVKVRCEELDAEATEFVAGRKKEAEAFNNIMEQVTAKWRKAEQGSTEEPGQTASNSPGTSS